MNCQAGTLGTLTAPSKKDDDNDKLLRAALTSLYAGTGAPWVLVYNASMLTPDSLLNSDVAHLHQVCDVDVVGAIVATQVAAPAMRAAGGGRPPRSTTASLSSPGPAGQDCACAAHQGGHPHTGQTASHAADGSGGQRPGA